MLITDNNTQAPTATFKETTPVQGAVAMARRGLRITPLRGKAPFLSGWQESATTDIAQIKTWAEQHAGCNFGCVFKRGEFWAVDEDIEGVIDAFVKETRIPIETFRVESSAERYHWYFKATEDSDARLKNIAQNNFAAGAASVRFDREQCVCPFSVHPEKHTVYMPVGAPAPAITAAPKEFISWLLDHQVVRTNHAAQPVASGEPRQKIAKGGRNTYIFTRAASLRAQGLTHDEISTILYRENEELLEPSLEKSELDLAIKHGASYKQGDPTPTTLIGGKLPGQAVASISTVPEVFEWSEVAPLDDQLRPVAPFKPEFLPDSIRPWVVDVSERMSVPLDFTGICALTTIAGVIGRRVFVCPKAKDKEWRESVALSGAVVAESGKTKTPTWKTFTNIVVEKEADWQEDHKKKAAKYAEGSKAWEALDKKNKEAEKKTGVVQNTPPAPEEPTPSRRLLLNDATPEKMHDVMKSNPCGLFYLRDELSSWVAEFDKEGREVQRGMFLAAMNGNDPYTVDRIGRDGGAAIMCVSVFGGFQPDMFRDFLNNATNVSDGTIPRFPFLVWPDESDLPIVDRPADDSAKQQFRRVIRELAEMNEKQVLIHFSPEAQTVFDRWLVRLNQKIHTEENSGKRSHLSKYKGALPKIAALLQIVDLVSNGPLSGTHVIDLAHINKAIELLTYLETHMHRIYGCIQTPIQKAESAIASRLTSGDLDSGFTIRGIQRKHWRDLSKPEYIDLALETFVEKGWLRDLPKSEGRGRPTTAWEINPALQRRTNGGNDQK